MSATAPLLPAIKSGRWGRRHAKVNHMNTGELWAAVVTVVGGPVVVDWLKGRRDRKGARKAIDDAQPFALNEQLQSVFDENAKLRHELRNEIAELRSELTEEQRRNGMLSRRIADMESELSEWRTGNRGLYGVWVAVPAEIWQTIRNGEIPPLPPQLPGEDRRRPI